MIAAGTRIVILGAGTAGWMAACLMAKAWPEAAITLVESPEIGIIGVGEGSTPQLKAFFDGLGIAETEWMPACDATYKTGIAFAGWSEQPGYARYFHPFATELDGFTEPQFHVNALLRRQERDVPAHPDAFFLNTRLAERRLAPQPAESFPFRIAYGYHFDAHKVGSVLRAHAIRRGARHLERRIDRVELIDGQVAALVAGDERIVGELFVDASGFRSTIAQEALGVPFRSFAKNLFNDRAVVLPTPAGQGGPEPFTTATALSSGWAWRIPLTARTGNGYVYASGYTSDDAAETELRRHLGLLDADVPARHLRMKVGRVETSWSANCLAVGLAQGFLEPLEATALHIVQATVERFIAAWRDGRGTPRHRDAFNAAIARRYDGIRDYIVCHYRANGRTDTAYWRDAAANDRLSDSLKAILSVWFRGGDLPAEIARQDIAKYYAPLSWGCLLAGYGRFPDHVTAAPDQVDIPGVERFLSRAALNFRDHAAALRDLHPVRAA